MSRDAEKILMKDLEDALRKEGNLRSAFEADQYTAENSRKKWQDALSDVNNLSKAIASLRGNTSSSPQVEAEAAANLDRTKKEKPVA